MKVIRQCFFIGIIIWIAACNGKKQVVPLDRIEAVKTAISQAKENEAETYAPLELKFAEEKLQKAKMAMQERDFEKALEFAEEAAADAKFAETRSRAEKAKKLLQEIQPNSK
ncbi:MAG: hypothetical protein BWK80_10905 [Desulfobacteraceae bacterium IS3]|nr:MAG: hypothetical protein BWK80_10905 [Desulfobacteraceae bacterium IS3]